MTLHNEEKQKSVLFFFVILIIRYHSSTKIASRYLFLVILTALESWSTLFIINHLSALKVRHCTNRFLKSVERGPGKSWIRP